MFDLLLVFLHKGFMLFLLFFFCVLRRISFDINNALWRSDSGRENIIGDIYQELKGNSQRANKIFCYFKSELL